MSKMARAYSMTSNNLYSINEERPACGFLNRKTLKDGSGKKSKDHRWQTVWCQIVESSIIFYKVDKIADRDPPPKDIYPLPNCIKHKVGSAELDEALIELDFTHQKDIDIDKRRQNLFRLVIGTNLEIIFQAPSQNQMHQWVHHLRRASWKSDDGDEESDLLRGDGRIKMTRCSINKKSKHNTNSVRLSGIAMPSTEEEDSENHPSISLIELDPRLLLLKKRLQSKRELLKHLQKMLTSFSGDTEALYREADPNSSVGRRQSMRPVSVNLSTSASTSFAPSSVSGYSLSSSHSDSTGFHSHEQSITGDQKRQSANSDTLCVDGVYCTTLTEDRYILPGAEWSLMRKGDTVEVLGRLPNGWYRCRAMRSAAMDLKAFPSSTSINSMNDDVIMEDGDSNREHKLSTPDEDKEPSQEQIPSSSPETADETEPRTEEAGPHTEENGNRHSLDISQAGQFDNEEDSENKAEDDDDLTPVIRRRTDSYAMAMVNTVSRARSLGRSDSYHRAAANFVDSGTVTNTRHLSLLETSGLHPDENRPSLSSKVEIQKLRINNLLEHERANSKYVFPLIGTIPPSCLQHFAEQAIGRPTSSTSDYASSTPMADDSPPQSSAHNSGPPPQFELPISPSVPINGALPKTLEPQVAMSAPVTNPAPFLANGGNSLAVPQHTTAQRSSSLPPPIEAATPPSDPTLNIPSRKQARRRSLTVIASPSNSLERNTAPPTSEKGEHNKGRRKSDGDHSLDDGQKPSVLKKLLFGTKKQSGPVLATAPEDKVITEDSRQPTALKKSILPSHLLEPNSPSVRSRVASISGKPVWARGREVRIGEESSSDSESEGTISPRRPISRNDDHSSPEEGIPSSVENSPLLVRKMMKEDGVLLHGDPMPKSHGGGPLELLKSRAITRIQSDNTILDSRKEKSTEGLPPFNRRSSLYDGCKLADYIQPPEKGVRRCIELDTSHERYGFHMETYELHLESGRVPQTFIQHVVPGSPAFVVGLYPGDCILEVNGQDMHHCHANEVVAAVQRTKGNRVEIVVAFVDGVSRLKLMKKAEELRTQMKERQTMLEDLQISQQTDTLKPPPTSSPLNSALELSTWSNHTPLSSPDTTPCVYPHSARLNSMLAIYHDSVTELKCDMLVLPFDVPSDHIATELSRVLQAGGPDLMIEMSLLEDNLLGENLLTSGHLLPAQTICHCMFGTSEDHAVSCCRSALETAYEQEYSSIVFWVDGFVKSCISPHVIISAVREWLEEGENSRGLMERVVLALSPSSGLLELVGRYFPTKPPPSTDDATATRRAVIPSTSDDINLDALSSYGGSDTGPPASKEESTAADQALAEAMSMLSNRVQSMLAEDLPPITTPSPEQDNSNGGLEIDKLDSIFAELDEQVTSFTADAEDWEI